MKGLFILCLLFYTGVAFSQQSGSNGNIADREKKGNISHFLGDINQYTLASSNFNILYARCSWTIDPSVYGIRGAVMHKIQLSADANSVVFDLDNSLVVDSVTMHNSPISFLQNIDKTLTLSFSQNLLSGTVDSFTIYYHGAPAGSGFGSFTQTTHGDVPVIWTLSEPYGGRDWWPCRNGLDDKIDSLDIFITNPSQYNASANGLPVDAVLQNGNLITHFRHRYPVATYLVGIAVTNYQTFSTSLPLQSGNLPVTTTVYPESYSYFQDNIGAIYNALQLYDKNFGAYPFAKERYGQTQFSWGGGMEHQSNSFVVNPDQYLMAHELAHQWFGDKITTGSWADIWLNEGFATYLADFFYSEYFQPGELKRIAQQSVDYATNDAHGSVWVDDTTDVNRIFSFNLSYKKGAMLLRMLRWRLGDSAFFTGIRNYINDPALQYRFTHTTDLKRNLEAASGKKLDRFFNEWFYGKGYPSFAVQWNWDDGKMYLQIDETTSDASMPFFQTPLQLRFSGGTNMKDIIINIDKSTTKLGLPLSFRPDSVLIDPEQYLVSKNNVSKEGSRSDLFVDYPFLLYPNPASNILYIRLAGVDTVRNQTIRIVSSSGAVVYHKYFQNLINNTVPVPVVQLSSGLYFIIVQDEKGNLIKKKFIRQ